MFYDLPNELIEYIYEFDPTYVDLFNSVLNDLQSIRFSKFDNMIYYVYYPEEHCLHMTNNLERPYYICTSYGINLIKYFNIVKQYNLQEFDLPIGFNLNMFYVDNLLFYH